MGKLKEAFAEWERNFATEEEKSLPRAEKEDAFWHFVRNAENFEATVEQIAEEFDDWGDPRGTIH